MKKLFLLIIIFGIFAGVGLIQQSSAFSGAGDGYIHYIFYPSPIDDTTVKAIQSGFGPSYNARYAVAPNSDSNNHWVGASTSNLRFHFDLGSAQTANLIYYRGGGAITPKDFTFWGSNSSASFATYTDYNNDTGWTQLTTSVTNFNNGGSGYINVTNTNSYRYYAFKFANNWGSNQYIALAQLEVERWGTPYQIVNWSTLNETRNGLGNDYALMNNLNLSMVNYSSIGANWSRIGNSTNGFHFTGTFDGQGNTISDLNVNRTLTSYSGLFGYMDGATLKNLNLRNETLNPTFGQAGGLAGGMLGSTVDNCSVTGVITSVGMASNMGGLFGSTSGGIVNNSYFSGNITSYANAGGISSNPSNGVIISNCHSSGYITASSTYCGGITAVFSSGTVQNCWSDAFISSGGQTGGISGGQSGGNIYYSFFNGSLAGNGVMGGISGQQNSGGIYESYSVGNITSGCGSYVGGILGYEYGPGMINSSYAVGNVPNCGSAHGGIVGEAHGSVLNSYWDINKTNMSSSSGGGTGLTTDQMKDFTSFNNSLNIINTFSFLNNGYPFLSLQNNVFNFIWSMFVPYVDVYPVISATYNTNVSQLNYTFAFQNNSNAYCWYSKDLGATNSSILAAGNNFTDVISKSGNNNWSIFCNDSSGKVYNKKINFFINNAWYNNATLDNSYRVNQFVKVNGTNFTLGNQRYRFLGADAYYIIDYATNSTYDDAGNKINNSQAAVIEILNEAQYLNINVLRIWALMVGGNTTAPTCDWAILPQGGHYNTFLNGNVTNYNDTMYRAMDFTLNEMSKRDIRGQVVFVNNWDAYGGMDWWVEQSPTTNKTGDPALGVSVFNDNFHDQFYTDPWVITHFQQFINYTLNRNNTYNGILYKNDPTILSWQLTNEARAKGYNNANNITNLFKIANWTKNMTTFMKQIDSNHMITLGLEGFSYNETWGEGTDFIIDQNNTGIDFATFELHPAQWDYFAQRSENATNAGWVNGTINAATPQKVVNTTLLWWVNGTGFSFNNRYNGNVPAYDPKLVRHGYQNWVQQNTNWSKLLLKMPVVIEELAVPTNTTILNDAQKKLFFNNVIHNFYQQGGDGFMMWNFNHDGYYYSTNGTSCHRSDTGVTGAGCMDDGYSFYLSDDPTLKAKSQGVISAYNFTKYDNNGSSWVNYLSNYNYDFTVNLGVMSDSSINNCTLNLAINNGTVRNVITSNTSVISSFADYVIGYSFNPTDTDFTWHTICCANNTCYDSGISSTVYLSSARPVITLTSLSNNTVTNNENVTFNYSVADSLDISNCQLYIDGLLNQTNTNANAGDNSFSLVLNQIGTLDYNWSIQCSDIVSTLGYSETRHLVVDKTLPGITTNSPYNNTYSNNANVNFDANYSDDLAIRNATSDIYDSSGNLVSHQNQSYNFYGTNISIDDVSSGYSMAAYSTNIDLYGVADSGTWVNVNMGGFQNDDISVYVYSYTTAPDTTRVYSYYSSWTQTSWYSPIQMAQLSMGGGGSGYAIGDQLTVNSGFYNAVLYVDGVDGTAGSIASFSDGLSMGLGYSQYDTITVDGGNNDATIEVDSVGALGEVTSYHFISYGSGYATGSEITTTSTSGTGFLINIDSIYYGSVTSFYILAGGNDYYNQNSVSTSGGTGAGCYIDITQTDTFGVYSQWYDYGGTQPTEGYIVQAYSNNQGPYWIDVGASGSISFGDFSGWNNGWFSNYPSTPYSVSTGNLHYNNDWYVYSHKTVDGQIVYSANPYTISDADWSGSGWRTDLGWSSVDGADGYIVYNSQNNQWIDTASTSITDDGYYNGWTSGSPPVTPSSPYTYDHSATTSDLFNLIVTLPDNVYNWFVNIIDWSGNNYVNNNTIIVDTYAPQLHYVAPTEIPGSAISRTDIKINVSTVDNNYANTTTYLYNSGKILLQSNFSTLNKTYIDYTGLSDGIYYFNASSYDLAGNYNTSMTQNVTIDTLKPTFTNQVSNNGTLWYNGIGMFNITIANSNGTAFLEIDGKNITATNITSTLFTGSYNVTIPNKFVAGNYSYKWYSYSNGPLHLSNESGTDYLIVSPYVDQGGGASGGNTYIVNAYQDNTQLLNNISFIQSNITNIGKDNLIIVYAYNLNNDLINVDNISMQSLSNILLNYEVKNISTGVYQITYTINNQNQTRFRYGLIVTKNNKKIVNEYDNAVQLSGLSSSMIQSIKQNIESIWKTITDNMQYVWFSFAMLAFIVLCTIAVRLNKRK